MSNLKNERKYPKIVPGNEPEKAKWRGGKSRPFKDLPISDTDLAMFVILFFFFAALILLV